MKFDVRPMLRGKVSEIDIDYPLTSEELDIEDIPGGAYVRGKITDNAGYMKLTATVSFTIVGECARCLDEISREMNILFSRTVVTEGTLTDEQLSLDIDEYVVLNGGFLEIDEDIREAVLLNLPMILLCSDDCPGLCPMCGKHKRDGDCGCVPEKNPSPWDVLADKKFGD